MRIVFFISQLSYGGAERVVSTLANYSSAQGYEVYIILINAKSRRYSLDPKVKIIDLGFSVNIAGFISIPIIILKVYYNIIRIKPNVIYSFVDTNNLIAYCVGKLTRTRTVLSERSNPKYFVNRSLSRLKIFKYVYSNCDCMVLQTNSVQKAFHQLNISFKKSIVIPNPINDKFLEKPDVLVGKQNIILSIGRFTSEKNHFLLLNAAKQLHDRNWKFILIGEGPLKHSYLRYIQDNDISNFTILDSTDNVIDYYLSSKIFVLTSTYEGFPNCLIEAMATGCISISSNCEFGPDEIIDHNINGFLFPEGDLDSLVSTLNFVTNLDENDRNLIVEQAFKDSLSYRSEFIASKWLSLSSDEY